MKIQEFESLKTLRVAHEGGLFSYSNCCNRLASVRYEYIDGYSYSLKSCQFCGNEKRSLVCKGPLSFPKYNGIFPYWPYLRIDAKTHKLRDENFIEEEIL